MTLTDLSDDALVAELHSCCFQMRRLTARIAVCLGEIEDRRIHLQSACSSLYDFCLRRLGMSDGQAYRYVTAARHVRRYPFLVERIERGELHLSTLATLHPYITDENVRELVDATAGKKRREAEWYVAERFGTHAPPRISYRNLLLDRELRDLIDVAADLLSHAVPDRDPMTLAKRAFRLLIEHAEKERYGKGARPKKKHKGEEEAVAQTKTVPVDVRREVYQRDGGQCTYVDERTGERCQARAFLELDHRDARGKGGGHEPENLRLRCSGHNKWSAEQTYGRAYVEKRTRLRQRRSGRADRGAGEGSSTGEKTSRPTSSRHAGGERSLRA